MELLRGDGIHLHVAAARPRFAHLDGCHIIGWLVNLKLIAASDFQVAFEVKRLQTRRATIGNNANVQAANVRITRAFGVALIRVVIAVAVAIRCSNAAITIILKIGAHVADIAASCSTRAAVVRVAAWHA